MLEALKGSQEAVAAIAEKTEAIPQTMERLETVLKVNQHQIEELNRHLEAFRELRDRAVEAIPKTREQVEAIMADMKGGRQ